MKNREKTIRTILSDKDEAAKVINKYLNLQVIPEQLEKYISSYITKDFKTKEKKDKLLNKLRGGIKKMTGTEILYREYQKCFENGIKEGIEKGIEKEIQKIKETIKEEK